MTVEYVVLGAVLIVAGGVQAWLRHGPEGRAMQAEQRRLAARRVASAAEDEWESAEKAAKRGTRAWNSWTAILGGVSILLGIVLVVAGVAGQ